MCRLLPLCNLRNSPLLQKTTLNPLQSCIFEHIYGISHLLCLPRVSLYNGRDYRPHYSTIKPWAREVPSAACSLRLSAIIARAHDVYAQFRLARARPVSDNVVSYLNKGLPSSYLGRGNNNRYSASSKLHKEYFAKEESDFCSDTQKC